MKNLFLLTFLSLCSLTSAQPYKSIFGDASTMWIIKWYNLDFGGIDTIVVEKDTMAFGFTWKKIILTQRNGFFESGALLREDTLTGKVWYRPLEPGFDSTYLAFDFALEAGDTFDLSSNYNPWSTSVQVNSTDNMDGVKRILFHSYIEEGENVTFIEGVGGNQGPIYKESGGLLHPYLLCAYKDDIQTYANIAYDGNCDPPTGLEETESVDGIVVYPNPVDDALYIKNLSQNTFKTIEVFDALGRSIYRIEYQTLLDFHALPTGVYHVRLISNTGHSLMKSVFRR